MSKETGISIDSNGQWAVSGELTLETVSRLYREGMKLFARNAGPMAIDLQNIATIDSAGLALLLEWQSQAADSFRIINCPTHLARLVQLAKAEHLLDLGNTQAH